jgi:hypothetical protein
MNHKEEEEERKRLLGQISSMLTSCSIHSYNIRLIS